MATQKDDQKLVFKTDYRLMHVKSIAECSKGSILQYFRPSLSYHLSLRSLIGLFLSGCLRQVLLYFDQPCSFPFHLQTKYSPNANLYVTCSKDGHIKIWDAVSSLCVNTFKNAHDGQEVCSVLFTRNSKVCLLESWNLYRVSGQRTCHQPV